MEPTPIPAQCGQDWPTITLFGDSLTRLSMDPDTGCWGSMLYNKLGGFFDVNVRGFAGYNTRWCLDLMPKLFPSSYLKRCEIFIPFLGANDSWSADTPLHVPVEEFERNMRSIIKYLIANGVSTDKIIMITPGWYHHDNFCDYQRTIPFGVVKGFFVPKSVESAEAYCAAVRKVAYEHNIDLIDFYSVTKVHEPLEELFCDGIHYSRIGAKKLFDLLMPVIQRKIEASYKKPLASIFHTLPAENIPSVVEAFERAVAENAASKK